VAIGSRKSLVIDVGKDKLITVADPQVGGWQRRCREDKDEEKILPQAEDRA
jgi:hypothetical protein